MSESFRAWWLGQVAEAHWRRLVKEGTIQPVIPERRKPGRPPKLKQPFFAVSGFTYSDDLAQNIARKLRFGRRKLHVHLSKRLALAGVWYDVLWSIQAEAPLVVRRQGRRAKIHLAWLLAECAKVYQIKTGKDARAELLRIGERTEGESEIIAYARIVLKALGIKHRPSLRQQARQAVKYL